MAVWQPGSGIAVHNVKCGVFHLFVSLFDNPILVSIVAPLELGLGTRNPRFVAGTLEVGLRTHNPCFVAWPLKLGSGTHSPRFVAWPLKLGLGTRSPRFVAWPIELGFGTRNARSTVINRSTVFVLHCFVLLCVPIKMQGVGLLDFTLGYSTIVYLTFFSPTLPCPVLTYSSQSCKVSDKCVRGGVGKLPIASLGTGLQQAFATTFPPPPPQHHKGMHGLFRACRLQRSGPTGPLLLPRPCNLLRKYQRRQQQNLRPRPQVMRTLGLQFWTGKLSVPQNLLARWLELLMVFSCADQVTTVVMIVHMKVVKPSDGSGTTTMLAVGGLEKSGSASTTRLAYMQGTSLHLPLAMTLKLQYLLASNCPQRALALMREAFPGDPLVSKMTAPWITSWAQCRRPPPLFSGILITGRG